MEYVGRKIGPYELLEVVGSGGMGTVYRAKDTRLGKIVAFKVLLRKELSTEDGLAEARRLRDEAKAAAKVRHQGLMNCLAADDDGELGPYVVYEFISGSSLRHTLVEKGPLPLDFVVQKIAKPLLEGLSCIHALGVVHRDIKPENLFQREDRAFALGDFGLALFEGRQAKTKTGLIVGTPGYIGPEILLGAAKASPLSDIYSAAVTITEALIGALPFGAKGEEFSLKSQLMTSTTPKDLIQRGLSPQLAPVLSKALARYPEERFTDCEDFYQALHAAAQKRKPGATVQVPRAEKSKGLFNTTKTLVHKWRWRLMSFCLAVLSLAAFFGLYQYFGEGSSSLKLIQKGYLQLINKKLADGYISSGELDELLRRTMSFLKSLETVDGKNSNFWPEAKSRVSEILDSDSPEFSAIQATYEAKMGNWRRASLFWKRALDSQLDEMKKKGDSLESRDLDKWSHLLIRFVTCQKVALKERREAIATSSLFLRDCPFALFYTDSADGLRVFHFLLWAVAVLKDGDKEAIADITVALRSFVKPLYLGKECEHNYSFLLRRVKSAYKEIGLSAPAALGLPLKNEEAFQQHLEKWRQRSEKQRAEAKTIAAAIGKAMDEAFFKMQLRRSKLKMKKRHQLRPLRKAAWTIMAIALSSREPIDRRDVMAIYRYIHRTQFFEKESPTYKLLTKDGQKWSVGFDYDLVIETSVDFANMVIRQLERKDKTLTQRIAAEYYSWFTANELVRMNVGAYQVFNAKLGRCVERSARKSLLYHFFNGYRLAREDEMAKAISEMKQLWQKCLNLAREYEERSRSHTSVTTHHLGWLVNDAAHYLLEALKKSGDDMSRRAVAQQMVKDLDRGNFATLKKGLYWKSLKPRAIVHWADAAFNNKAEFKKVEPLVKALIKSEEANPTLGNSFVERAKKVLQGASFPAQSFRASPLLGIYKRTGQ